MHATHAHPMLPLCPARGNGTGGRSIYGRKFPDENFAIQHFMERVKIYTNEGFDFKLYNVEMKD